MKGLTFMADLHIKDDDEIEKFSAFLRELDSDALFLLGDIFEFMSYDNKECMKKYSKALEEMKTLSSKGTRIVFVEGNHDFCLGEVFSSFSGCEVYRNQYELEMDGKRGVLLHGDLFFVNRAFKKILRSRMVQNLVKKLPSTFVMRTGFFLSSLNRKRGMVRRSAVEKERNFIKRWFSKGYNIVISAHLHISFIERINFAGRECLWINPGGPRHYCVYEGGRFFLREY